MSRNISEGRYYPASDKSLAIPYKIQKSRRKTWSLSLQPDGSLLIKIPLWLPHQEAFRLMEQKADWITEKYHKWQAANARKKASTLTDTQRKALEERYRKAAKEYFPARVAYYEKLLGVTHTSITIRDQKTRWGSCSARGGLNFNWRLMLAPPRILDYVVVHELCHRKEMNHSKAFWNAVEMILPDYKELRAWLRENGSQLTLS